MAPKAIVYPWLLEIRVFTYRFGRVSTLQGSSRNRTQSNKYADQFYGGLIMGATQRRFTYKCDEGHLSSRDFPLGTRYDEYDTIFCVECACGEYAAKAYIVAVDIIEAKDSGYVKRSA